MSNNNTSVRPSVSASGEIDSLLIEKFTGKLNEANLHQENLMRYFDVQPVVNTNKVSEKYIGETELQVLAQGTDVDATGTEFDNNSLIVDTTVIGRNSVGHLDDVQKDIDSLKSKLSTNQVKQHKKLEDKMLVQQLINSAVSNTKAKRTKPRVSGHGFSRVIAAKTEDLMADPNLVMAAIEDVMENMFTGTDGGDGIEPSDVVIMMPWVWFNVLRDAERICNSIYSTASGATVTGFTLKSYNVPVVPSNRFPTVAAKSLLSNPSNGARYDTTAAHLGAVALIFGADALLVGRSIELASDIWQDKRTKAYMIDSWQSEGATAARWEYVGLVQATSDATPAPLLARAKRKALPMRTVA